jgi:hypothetical protein
MIDHTGELFNDGIAVHFPRHSLNEHCTKVFKLDRILENIDQRRSLYNSIHCQQKNLNYII